MLVLWGRLKLVGWESRGLDKGPSGREDWSKASGNGFLQEGPGGAVQLLAALRRRRRRTTGGGGGYHGRGVRCTAREERRKV